MWAAPRSDCPSWPGGVDATSRKCYEVSSVGADGVVVLDREILTVELEPPPRLHLRSFHPSWPGGVIGSPEPGIYPKFL
jgi:hypothetical protein